MAFVTRGAALFVLLSGLVLLVTSALPAGSTSANPVEGVDVDGPTVATTASSPAPPAPPQERPSSPGQQGGDEDSASSASWEEDVEVWDPWTEALAESLHEYLAKPLLSLLLSEEYDGEPQEQDAQRGDNAESEEDEDEDEDEEEEDWDWEDLWMGRRRRSIRADGAPDSAAESPSTNAPDSEEEGEEDIYDELLEWLILSAKDSTTPTADNSLPRDGPPPPSRRHFLGSLRELFFRARNRVLSRGKGGDETHSAQEVARVNGHPAVLVASRIASRAFNVSQAEAGRAFDTMAFRWVGEALYELLFENDEDDDDGEGDDDPWDLMWHAGVKVNGTFNLSGDAASSSNSAAVVGKARRRGLRRDLQRALQRVGDLDLSPTSLAYFLVEVLGTMAGLGWGAWFTATHAG